MKLYHNTCAVANGIEEQTKILEKYGRDGYKLVQVISIPMPGHTTEYELYFTKELS